MEINRPATIDGNATFLTEDFQHHLKKFLNFYYEFYHVFIFLICNIFLVSKIVGLVGEWGFHGRNFSCCLVGGLFCPRANTKPSHKVLLSCKKSR